MYENCDLVRFSSPFPLLALHTPRSEKITPGKIALTRRSRARDTPPMHEIDGLVRYAKATRASRSPPQGIQPQICCNLHPLFAAYLRLYMNQRTEASARPGETPIRPRESTGNWYTTANLLQSTGPNCSIFAVVYESGERSTHMTQEKLCLPCLPRPRHQASGNKTAAPTLRARRLSL